MLYRALLPAVATGTVEERSIVEPVRRILKKKVRWSCGHASIKAALACSALVGVVNDPVNTAQGFFVCTLRQGKYFEAICTDIDPEERSLVACFPPEAGLDDTCFKVPYDMLILGAALPGEGALRNALRLGVRSGYFGTCCYDYSDGVGQIYTLSAG